MTRLPTQTTRSDGLVDQFGRTARDLRVSVTDRCNLRCTYCMPAEGLPRMPKSEMLTDEEMVRVIGLFVRDGITQGAPHRRRAAASPLPRRGRRGHRRAGPPSARIAMITNGVGLERIAGRPEAAGLDRVNISLDTIDSETFTQLTRRDRLADVEAGLRKAGLTPVKVNAVAMCGINDDGVVHLLAWCLERDYELRFIEQMPLDAQHVWHRGDMVTAAEIRERLSERYVLAPLPAADRGSAPAERCLVDGGPATVGIVASVTAAFCAACDRARLTADGQVRNCLFSGTETDLRTPLHDGATDDEPLDLMRGAMWRKRKGHGIGDPGFVQPERPMRAIGG